MRTEICNSSRARQPKRTIRCASPAWLTAFFLAACAAGRAQEGTSSEELVRTLQDEIRALKARVQVLESRAGVETPASPAAPAAAAETVPEPFAVAAVSGTFDQPPGPLGPALSLQGFGDAEFRFRNAQAPSSFALGQLDFFVRSTITDRLRVLVETVIETDSNNEAVIDVERLLLHYRAADFLNLDLGRYHTGIGYYNRTYHHGSYFETAQTRPFLFEFEDEEGLLPIHNVGISVTGKVPSGPLGLNYLAEVGNGRSYRSSGGQSIQIVQDEDGSKAWNAGFFLRPPAWEGVELGAGFYRDRFGVDAARYTQKIYSAYAVFNKGPLELLNEAIVLRHAQNSGPGNGNTTSVAAFYNLLSYRLGDWRPYFRFEFLNPHAEDPVARSILSEQGIKKTVTGGIRYDFADYAAVKMQVDRFLRKNQDATHQVSTRFSFAF